ncbi:MAG: IclR family transcriptional regulator [Anaerolineales bacterium]|nr:IclR family transcriptional regulator [Anaerolineales bacterium]
MKDPNEYNVRAVERALQILDCFDDEHPERGISEIAQVAGLHKATAYRIVTTLVNYGYLEWVPDVQKYRLGLALSNLGYKVIRRMDLRREALPYMKELVHEWDETCDLSIFDQGRVFYLEVLRSNHALMIAAAVGQQLPAHCTASGKLFLAYLPSEELDAILNKPLTAYTDNTITSPDQLRDQLEVIRQRGFSVDNEEYELGIYAVAAPIFNRSGTVIAAIGGPCPTSRMTPARITEIAEAFKKAARAISYRMGYGQ